MRNLGTVVRYLSLAAIGILAFGAPLHAQIEVIRAVAPCQRPGPGAGVIAGKIVSDSVGLSLRRPVRIDGWVECMVTAAVDGTFSIRGVPAGNYQIYISTPSSMSHIRRIPVRVVADSTTRIEARLKPGNKVSDCMELPACARIIQPATSSAVASLSDEGRLLEAALRASVALSQDPENWETAQNDVCIWRGIPTDSSRVTIMASLRVRAPIARECDPVADRPTSGRQAAPPGPRATRAGVSSITRIAADRANADLRMGNAAYLCVFERTEPGWRPVTCRVTGAG